MGGNYAESECGEVCERCQVYKEVKEGVAKCERVWGGLRSMWKSVKRFVR